jgi:hypothetical protein
MKKTWWYMDGLIENNNFQSEKKSLGIVVCHHHVYPFHFYCTEFPCITPVFDELGGTNEAGQTCSCPEHLWCWDLR